jgi:hypothetical protein
VPDPVIEIFHRDWERPVELTRDEATDLMHELKAFLEPSRRHLTVQTPRVNVDGNQSIYKGIAIRKRKLDSRS